MRIAIYQINAIRDENHVMFYSTEVLRRVWKTEEIDSSIYDRVFEGEVDCRTPEDVFVMFNGELPADYNGRSLSVSDVVQVLSGDYPKGYYYCETIGFKRIKFDGERTGSTEEHENQ